jgi:hypothetical protein
MPRPFPGLAPWALLRRAFSAFDSRLGFDEQELPFIQVGMESIFSAECCPKNKKANDCYHGKEFFSVFSVCFFPWLALRVALIFGIGLKYALLRKSGSLKLVGFSRITGNNPNKQLRCRCRGFWQRTPFTGVLVSQRMES